MPKPKSKPSVGRPTVYKNEYVDQARALCRLGATETDLANFFKVTVVTIWRWRTKYPEFCSALKIGRDIADDRVESSLYHRANGYTYDTVKIFPPSGKREKPLIVPYKEHIPPDTTAAIFWLKNRRRLEWREKPDIEFNVSVNLLDLVNASYPEPPAPKTIEHDPE